MLSRRIHSHIRANVIGYVALFLALGGTSYALVITGAQVKDESLTGADVRNGSLKGADVDEATLGAVPNAVNAGTLDGIDSSAFLRDLSRHTQEGVFNSQSPKSATVNCPPGKDVIDSAAHIQNGATLAPDGNAYTHVAITTLRPTDPQEPGGSLFVQGYEISPTDVDWAIVARAICARVG